MKPFCATATLSNQKYQTQLNARQHEWIADEPPELGGSDKGMTPEEMLCGSLASCTAITLQMYTGRKEWPVEKIEVRVEHLSPKQRTDKEEATNDLFIRHLRLTGDLSPEQTERMLDIANKCPVHKTLSQGCDIDTRLMV